MLRRRKKTQEGGDKQQSEVATAAEEEEAEGKSEGEVDECTVTDKGGKNGGKDDEVKEEKGE